MRDMDANTQDNLIFPDSARGFENCPMFLHKVALFQVSMVYRPGIGEFQAVSKCLHGGMFGSSGLWEICLFRHIIEDLTWALGTVDDDITSGQWLNT